MTQTELANQINHITGHCFSNNQLLEEAVTHKSLGPKNAYERLEFFGDRVLGLIVSEHLYKQFHDADQGELTRRLHAVTQENYLAQIAVQTGLSDLIRHEAGEAIAQRPSVQSDVVEALIAALYLDGGIQAAEAFILKYWEFASFIPSHNPKSALQEWAAAQKCSPPAYRLIERAGPDHSPVFTVEVLIPGKGNEKAQGGNIKSAEAEAAKRLLDRMLASQHNQT